MENARKIARAFLVFGLPMEGFTIDDMADIGFQFFVGVRPAPSISLRVSKGLISHPHGRIASCQTNKEFLSGIYRKLT
jgi:hypothetical protein